VSYILGTILLGAGLVTGFAGLALRSKVARAWSSSCMVTGALALGAWDCLHHYWTGFALSAGLVLSAGWVLLSMRER